MFELNFADLLDPNHELMRAAELIDWDQLHEALRFYYSTRGRHGKPIRLMVGLQLLKHHYNCSDERAVEELGQFDAPTGAALDGFVRLNPPDRDDVITAVDHVENGLDDLADFFGPGIGPSHLGGNDLHADVPTGQFSRVQDLEAALTFTAVPLECIIDLVDSPSFSQYAELGFGSPVASAVKCKL